jgi:hypothetical protein
VESALQPDPKAAYAHAVIAVEFTVLPVVIPHDRKGTLGKARARMNGAPEKWGSALGEDGVEASSR